MMKRKHQVIVVLAAIVGAAVFFQTTRLGDDDEISEAAVDVLVIHPQIDADRLTLDVDEGVVTVTGSVADEDIRKIVIDEVEKVDGVDRVVDQMTIDMSGEQPPRAISK